MVEKKKNSSAGKFVLGAAIGAAVAAIAGKFVSSKKAKSTSKCNCGEKCTCKKEKKTEKKSKK